MKITNFAIAGLLGSLVACEDEELPTFVESWEENVTIGFNFCDKDGNGTVSYKEFVKCNRQLGEEENKIDRSFYAMDLNEDQKIDMEEAYLKSKRTYGPQPSGLGEDNFDAMFNWIDDNGDEKLTWYEFKACWDPLWNDWDYHMLKSTFKNADFDKDGSLDYNEAFEEYQSQNKLSRKFNIVDQDHDGKIYMKEWADNLLFVPKTNNDSVIRERFGYHDANKDGYLTRDELYHVIRPNQVRWKKFQLFWNQLDPTGDGWTDANEALDGMREAFDPEISMFQCEEFLKKYDTDKDGRVHKLQMWVAETNQWDKEREAKNKERAYKEIFSQGWFTYDANRDFSLTWAEVRYVRDLFESDAETEEFWKHFKNVEEVGDYDDATIAYDEAFKVWMEDEDEKRNFNKHWKIVDSDHNGKITIDDLYDKVGIIPSLTEENVVEVWQKMVTPGESEVYYHQGCEAFVNRFLCSEDYEKLRKYAEFKDGFSAWLEYADSDGDRAIGITELEQAVESTDYDFVEELMAYVDTDMDGVASMEEFFRKSFEYEMKKQQFIKLWERMDPNDRGVVPFYKIEEVFAPKFDWLPEDFWDNLDANNDGWVSARETCFKAGGFTQDCMELANEEKVEPEFRIEHWLGFIKSWYRIDRDQDEVVNETDLRAVRDATFTDTMVTDEFNYYDKDGDGVVTREEAWDTYFNKIQVRKEKFYKWFYELNQDENYEYLTTAELENDTKGIIVVCTALECQQEYHIDELCEIWFPDIPSTCKDVTPVEEDIAHEEVIETWYQFDKDADEKASRSDFITWAKTSEWFSWLSKYEVKVNIWDKMDTQELGEITFAQYRDLYNLVKSDYDKLSGVMHIISIDEVDSFDVNQLEAAWASIIESYPELNDNNGGITWFNELDTDQSGLVEYHELCVGIVGYTFCGSSQDDNHNDDSNGDDEWEAKEFFRKKIVQWYRVDLDQDEAISWQNLRDARYATYTDDQITTEFNHYDLDGDGVVTFEEADHVATEDRDSFKNWFRSLAHRDDDHHYMEHWEHEMDTSGKVNFFDADANDDWKLTEEEACPHYFSDYPTICDDIWSNGSDIADEEFVYRWYDIDSDKDEIVSFEDLFAWTRTFEWKKYAWMTEVEVREQMFDKYDTNQDGTVSFAEAKAGYDTDKEKKSFFDGIWWAINPNWEYKIDQSLVEQNWESLDESQRQGKAYAFQFFQLLDLDSNGKVTQGEGCVAIIGRAHICDVWYDYHSHLTWKVDFNLDRYVSNTEFERAFGKRNSYKYQWKPYWENWIMQDYAVTEAGVPWSRINERIDLENQTKNEWNNTLTDHGRDVWENTTITVEEAATWFELTSTTFDLNGDGKVHYSEFCMERIKVEAACLHEIELAINYYDVSGTGGVNFEEFKAILKDEGDAHYMSDEFLELYFNLYDWNNNNQIEFKDIQRLEPVMDRLEGFSSQNWLDATLYLMDRNNDTYVDQNEFRNGMNIILSLVDLDRIQDEQTTETFYNNVFPVIEDTEDGPTAQQVGMMMFMKQVIKSGIQSYINDNDILAASADI